MVCHGDVHPGNIIQSANGPVLLDWDLACHAPAAWDHAMLLTWSAVWGGDSSAYERFAAGYGQSLADDPLAPSLAVMRNVTATLMRVKAGRTDSAADAEAQRRLQFWRGDPAAPSWNAQWGGISGAGRSGSSSRLDRRARRSARGVAAQTDVAVVHVGGVAAAGLPLGDGNSGGRW